MQEHESWKKILRELIGVIDGKTLLFVVYSQRLSQQNLPSVQQRSAVHHMSWAGG